MSGSRGEAAGVGGTQHSTSAITPPSGSSSTASTSSMMTRISQSSEHPNTVRTSNGMLTDNRSSIADLLSSSNLASPLRTLESGLRKRKLSDMGEDITSRRKRIAEHKAVRLKRLKKDYVEHVSEMLTLEGGGLADVYRKRPSTSALISYLKNNRLNPTDEGEDLSSYVTPVVQQPEVKTPGALPGIPSSIAAAFAAKPVVPASPLPEPETQSTSALEKRLLSPLKSSPATPSSSTPSNNKAATPQRTPQSPYDTSICSQEQIVERAKQEAQVMARIGELQKEGLWTEKRLPKVQEPPRTKAHWDYLLEEMVWLAADFAQERKWKKAAAKKCAKMVQKYFQDKELMAQKAVKSQELQLKRVANLMAKEIKHFWANAEKLVEYKHQTMLEEKRKKAMDQHLSFIVDQTEKYSSLVAEGLNKTGAESVSQSLVSSRAPSPTPAAASVQPHASDGEFEPGGTSSDDEETIAKAEAEDEKEGGIDNAKEIELLTQESELPLEDLLRDYLDNRENIILEEENEDEEEGSSVDKDEEFRASDKDSSDDEETIQEQEKAEGKVDHKQELDDLKTEGEMSIEELRAKYGGAQTNGTPMETESQESDSEEEVEEDEEEQNSESTSEDEPMEVEEEATTEDLSALLTQEVPTSSQGDNSSQQVDKKESEIHDVAAIAESIQPKGNTLSSTSVVTKVPFLLKHPLREYQHIGLDWLVTMHDRKLNGILADEMGLGKTIQTIAVLAHLACEKGTWGPHLIVVPTSVMLNWEMEIKKWCPAFKILTYYGSQKERKLKRTGWSKPNAFHICITSYKLVIQDYQSFRRKSWKYLILDEAQNIKNFKSQRWQLLLNFQTQRRLLLTGTPLQNNLMELWSLMHFLMPSVFQSHREFKEWFSNPVTGMIEGNSEYNEQIIKRLHKVLRPFLLRRLKCEVEKQLPKKYEHVVMCRLSNRQRYLYDDFMSRAKTRETLATGNLLSVINVLMQLRKVCNHPNLFEVRPTVSPFQMEAMELFTASCVWSALDYDPFKHVNLQYLNLDKISLELWMSAWMAHRSSKFRTPVRLIEEIDTAPPPPPKCPPGRIKVHVRFSSQANSQAQMAVRPNANTVLGAPAVRPGVTPTLVPRVGPSTLVRTALTNQVMAQGLTLRVPRQPGQLQGYSVQLVQQRPGSPVKVALGAQSQRLTVATGFAQLVQTSAGRHHLLFTSSPHLTTPGTSTAVMTSAGGQRLLLGSVPGGLTRLATPSSTGTSPPRPVIRVPTAATVSSPLAINHTVTTAASSVLVTSSVSVPSSSSLVTSPSMAAPSTSPSTSVSMTTRAATTQARRRHDEETAHNVFVIPRLEEKRRKWREEKLKRTAEVNEQRCSAYPLYGWDLVKALRLIDLVDVSPCTSAHSDDPELYWQQTEALSQAILSVEERLMQLNDLITRFVVFVPAVKAPRPRFHVSHPPPWKLWQEQRRTAMLEADLSPRAACLHPIVASMMTLFPDPSLIQYDCGKLQSLDRLLRRLKTEGHRVLIFTQMTRMLDVLEAFLNFHGHIYLRLDGTTKVDQRQVLMERFNGDKRIFCFILSTRSGGVGVNLTGADTVIFYDSDWNPTMDAQAQDRCHRIGQTRDVHIYRLVSEKTVEENILKKANQKRLLGDLAIEGGNFTTAYFKSSTIQDLFNVDVSENDASKRMAEVLDREAERRAQLNSEDTQQSGASSSEERAALGVLETAMAAAEDETDVAAAKTAKAEAVADLAEFDESIPFSHMDEEISKAEQEVNALVETLSGVERYAMKFIEETEAAFSSEQLAAAEAEIEQQKREWEEERLAALRMQEEEEERNAADASEELLTYSREDAQNQIWLSQNGREQMPMWCPPTPPVDDSDVYIDYTMCFLYEPTTMSEAQLPPVYTKKDRKRSRVESTSEGRNPIKAARHQREELSLMHAPRSLFDRPSPALIKMRHDLRLHKYRGGARPTYSLPQTPTQQLVPRPVKSETDLGPEWMIYEDWAILQAVQQVQELTLNLVVVCPGHTPNWEMVADMVNMISHIYRSPRQCKNRYESVIIPREEGKMIMDMNAKKPKKTKGIYKLPQTKCSRPMKTSQMYQQDTNMSYTQVMNAKFESIRTISNNRTPTMKPVLNNKPDMKNPKHAEVLSGCGIDYDNPMSPVDVATRRAERISKEKQLVAQQAQQLALLRNQMGVSTISSSAAMNKAIVAATASPTQTPTTAKAFVQAPLSVQELVVAAGSGGGQVVARASTPGPAVASPQRTTIVSQATTTVAAKVVPSKQLNPAQLQLYQKQALLRQQQLRAAALQGRAGAVPVTSPSQPRIHQVKQVSTVGTGEVAALIKRQAVAGKTVTPAQILAQAGLQAQGGSVAALVKTASGQHLPLTLPQVKAALPQGVKTATATPQQIRQLTLQNQLLAQQRSKLAGQKVGLGQVMVTNKGVPAQLIVQSQKSVPTTMTMQQIQQVIKHVHPQHLAHVSTTGGQTVVSQGTSGQVISHTVITKNQAGTSQTRLIPQQNVKQTIQVVTASPGGVRTSVPNVTIDRSQMAAGAIKVTGSAAQQQALLNQVTAVLQQGQQIAVRQAPVRIQTSGTNVTVSQAPTLLTLAHPQQHNTDNTQNQ
ncbi:helicase domino isoform X3 [Macrosteles quadrilineatus]|uniref:helicase domino isoform X3 n=1 Tax=Macrosteles quadrilineatus TaxID=74068 RepID=UPI0023E32F4A|nr:helicase domino isoform X3 [Macrosteles quadrilineatus]